MGGFFWLVNLLKSADKKLWRSDMGNKGVLLSGDEAIALGAYEAGVKVASAYPGTPSTEILENLARYDGVYVEWAPNEKVAYETAYGSAVAGVRAMAVGKHVGINVAADPLMTSAYAGVNAGFVLVSADDPSMHSSQNEQDNRNYAKFAKIPVLEPSNSEEARVMIHTAFEMSEQFDVPVMVRITTRIAHGKSVVYPSGERKEVKKDYQKRPDKYVMVPSNARKRKVFLIERWRKLREFAESFNFNLIEKGNKEVGVITSGVAYNYVKEIVPDASVLKLGMSFPIPEKMIMKFASQVKELFIVEDGDPFIEELVMSLGLKVNGKLNGKFPMNGELTPDIVAKGFGIELPEVEQVDAPPRPPVMCPGCPHRGVFYVLKKLRATVTGDIGCYTLAVYPPLESLETTICMGAGFSMAHGFAVAGLKKVVGVLGDSTFFHSGITSLMNAVYNGSNATFIVLDNRTTAMTGHQVHPGIGKTLSEKKVEPIMPEKIAEAMGVRFIKVFNPYDLKETEQVIREALKYDGVSFLVARKPCILIAPEEVKPPVRIVEDKCINCKICMRLGCPAIENPVKEDKPVINQSLCTGCDMCVQVCPVDAIVRD